MQQKKSKQVPMSRLEPNKYINYEKHATTLEIVKKRISQPLTLSEKILYSHADDPKKSKI